MEIDEVVFIVEEDKETGGYSAVCHRYGIFTQGEDPDDLRAMVLDAVECRFEGGYGDTPSEGQLLRGWALIVRFDRCRFSRLRLNLPGGRSTVLFDGCVLADLGDDPREDACHLKTVRFLDCRFENNWLPGTRRRLLCLEALFPDWRDRLVE